MLAAARQGREFGAFRLAQFDPVPYIHSDLLEGRPDVYGRMFRQAPAEADMQRHFPVTPPSVHHMVLTLEHAGLIRRQPGVARSIEVLIPLQHFLVMERLNSNLSLSP